MGRDPQRTSGGCIYCLLLSLGKTHKFHDGFFATTYFPESQRVEGGLEQPGLSGHLT